MQALSKTILGALTSAAAYLCYLLGGWDVTLKIMFLFMLLDYATGVIVSLLGRSPKTEHGGFLSTAAFLGISKKLLMLVVVMMATALDRMLSIDGVCRVATIGFYVANEGLSIVENAALLGVPFPEKLLEVLAQLREKGK